MKTIINMKRERKGTGVLTTAIISNFHKPQLRHKTNLKRGSSEWHYYSGRGCGGGRRPQACKDGSYGASGLSATTCGYSPPHLGSPSPQRLVDVARCRPSLPPLQSKNSDFFKVCLWYWRCAQTGDGCRLLARQMRRDALQTFIGWHDIS